MKTVNVLQINANVKETVNVETNPLKVNSGNTAKLVIIKILVVIKSMNNNK